MRVSKSFQRSERVRLTLQAESFNVSNQVNRRVDISDDGFINSTAQFVAYSTQVGKNLYPGEFVKNPKFLIPTNSCAPRQDSSRQEPVSRRLTQSNRHLCARKLALRWGHFSGTLYLT